jgi:hypothetical protein
MAPWPYNIAIKRDLASSGRTVRRSTLATSRAQTVRATSCPDTKGG